MFQTKDPNDCWNGMGRGKQCAAGVYVYCIVIENGFCKRTVLKGDVTLVR